MATRLQEIDTFVIVMMENRSFDHLLGYLSLPPHNRTEVDGLKEGTEYTNTYESKVYRAYPLKGSKVLDDPPHDRSRTLMQLGTPASENAPFPLDGFVKSYATRKPVPKDLSFVMGYHTAEDLPIYDFLAKNFAICDRWFTPIPTGTQPNRLMAMAGESRIADNASVFMPDQELVYDWLDKRKISWSNYSSGLFPFFALMQRWQDNILKDFLLPFIGKKRFKKFKEFQKDWTSKNTVPNVIFIEPEYSDILDDTPNDDHPPTDLKHGQLFIRSIYQTLISNPVRWQKTMLIITYDEGGGCFDHAQPIRLMTKPPKTEKYQAFTYTGGRVPALVASPYIEAGTVFHELLDHTSILQLLADRFDAKQFYSDAVSERHKVLGRLSLILNRENPRVDAPLPPFVQAPPKQAVSRQELTESANATSDAFQNARKTMEKKTFGIWNLFQFGHQISKRF